MNFFKLLKQTLTILIFTNLLLQQYAIASSSDVQYANEIQAQCLKSEFKGFQENKKEAKLEEYLEVKEFCSAFSLKSALTAVQNIRYYEKKNVEEVEKLNLEKKINNIQNRVEVLTSFLENKPTTLAEALIVLVTLRDYESLVKKNNDKNLNEFYNTKAQSLKSQKNKIVERLLKHDIKIVIADVENSKDKVIFKKEKKKLEQYLVIAEKYKQNIEQNLTCLANQKCFICGSKIETICNEEQVKKDSEKDKWPLYSKYEEAIENIFKSIDKL